MKYIGKYLSEEILLTVLTYSDLHLPVLLDMIFSATQNCIIFFPPA